MFSCLDCTVQPESLHKEFAHFPIFKRIQLKRLPEFHRGYPDLAPKPVIGSTYELGAEDVKRSVLDILLREFLAALPVGPIIRRPDSSAIYKNPP